ncbi:MAG: hypothetical protein ACI9R3_005337, partial [Verrucomicrobiales bacterium]
FSVDRIPDSSRTPVCRSQLDASPATRLNIHILFSFLGLPVSVRYAHFHHRTGYTPLPSDVFTIATSQLPISGNIGNLTEGRLTTVGNKGTFAVSVGGNALQLSDFKLTAPGIEDLDEDLLGDDWEREHFWDTTSSGALDDPDGDRISNLFEYALGTDPNTPGTLPFSISM